MIDSRLFKLHTTLSSSGWKRFPLLDRTPSAKISSFSMVRKIYVGVFISFFLIAQLGCLSMDFDPNDNFGTNAYSTQLNAYHALVESNISNIQAEEKGEPLYLVQGVNNGRLPIAPNGNPFRLDRFNNTDSPERITLEFSDYFGFEEGAFTLSLLDWDLSSKATMDLYIRTHGKLAYIYAADSAISTNHVNPFYDSTSNTEQITTAGTNQIKVGSLNNLSVGRMIRITDSTKTLNTFITAIDTTTALLTLNDFFTPDEDRDAGAVTVQVRWSQETIVLTIDPTKVYSLKTGLYMDQDQDGLPAEENGDDGWTGRWGIGDGQDANGGWIMSGYTFNIHTFSHALHDTLLIDFDDTQDPALQGAVGIGYDTFLSSYSSHPISIYGGDYLDTTAFIEHATLYTYPDRTETTGLQLVYDAHYNDYMLSVDGATVGDAFVIEWEPSQIRATIDDEDSPLHEITFRMSTNDNPDSPDYTQSAILVCINQSGEDLTSGLPEISTIEYEATDASFKITFTEPMDIQTLVPENFIVFLRQEQAIPAFSSEDSIAYQLTHGGKISLPYSLRVLSPMKIKISVSSGTINPWNDVLTNDMLGGSTHDPTLFLSLNASQIADQDGNTLVPFMLNTSSCMGCLPVVLMDQAGCKLIRGKDELLITKY